jgi:glycerophosphoryl diester phosphodiesterase
MASESGHQNTEHKSSSTQGASKFMTNVTARAGWSAAYPENTLVAFQRAIERGADRVEFDVQQSSDGALILHHFYVLGSTENGEGLIFERDLKYLKSLDAGSWKSPEFAGESIPLLEDVFAKFGRTTEYEVDLKGFTLPYLEDVLNLVRAYGLLDHVELTSTFSALLIEARPARNSIVSPRPIKGAVVEA